MNNLGNTLVERDTVHLADGTGRVAMLEVRTAGSDSDDDYTTGELKRFIYSNHLQSSALELDEWGEVISYEEYHPYGTTAYQAVSDSIKATAKRYRFTGKERDEESGLNYHGARYYAPWLCRWIAVDPLEGKYAGWSAYNYCMNNPVMMHDPDGMQSKQVEKTGVDGQGTRQNPADMDGVTVKPTWGDKVNSFIDSNRSWLTPLSIVSPVISPLNLERAEEMGLGSNNISEIRRGVVERSVQMLEGAYNLLKWYASTMSPEENRMATFDPGIASRNIERDLKRVSTLANGAKNAPAAIVKDYAELIQKARQGDRRAMGAFAFEVVMFFTPGGEEVKGGGFISRGSQLLSERKLFDAVETLRAGTDLQVESINQARQILKAMPDLRPHIDKFPSNSGELFSETTFGHLYRQPRGTYRGDLFPLNEELFQKGLIHDSKNIAHDVNPHYNIKFHNGKRATLIIGQ